MAVSNRTTVTNLQNEQNMKKIFFCAGMLLAATGLFTACEDDRDSNPTLLERPSEIVLNTPAFATQLYDLAHAKNIDITWSQPQLTDKGAPLAMNGGGLYMVQVSKDGKFKTSFAEAQADKTGATVADYVQLEETYNECRASINAASVAKALMQLYQWDTDNVPASAPIYVRVVATVRGLNAAAAPGTTTVSNVLKLDVVPYYIKLRDAAIELAYVVGSAFGDASWSNTLSGMGVGNVPMFPIDGFDYDKKTGKGSVSYTDYFDPTTQFKVLSHYIDPADANKIQWEYAYVADGVGKTKWRAGGDDGDNISVAAAGYYTVVVDNIKHTCTISPATPDNTKTFSSMGLIGVDGDWNTDIPMKAVNTKAANNHLWTCTITIKSDTEAKFRAEGGWDNNWGKVAFPYGKAAQNGANIKITKGTYKVFFNDLTGEYNFIDAE